MTNKGRINIYMENAIKYSIEIVYEDGCSESLLLESRRFDTREEALDWHHTSLVTADAWACSIRLVGTTYDENGFQIEVSCEELRGI